eukprot:gb/GECG01016576.1/.p1 GENE.gb/GECG01016576.1/~~gb/GECG01016576.1/.p1  ORF type:complete len:274 (+),score=30.28 gb/GECG01016576.1/:1-822(+)
MGAFLDKPKTEKHTQVQESASVRAGLTSMQGWRVEQEDAHSLILELPDNPQAGWFAVFDGHGGNLVSGKSAERLHKLISVDSLEPETLKPKIRNAFLQLDKELHEDPKVQRGEDHSGTTAVSCLLTPQHMICANCGDSRAILVRNREAKPLSYDHKPFNDKERERIYKAGGTVTMGRVNGDLAVSRALGDYVYKFVSDLPAEEQQVSPEPEFVVIPRDPQQDQFMVLACDGIWDVMSNDEVAKWVLDQTEAGCDNVGEVSFIIVLRLFGFFKE